MKVCEKYHKRPKKKLNTLRLSRSTRRSFIRELRVESFSYAYFCHIAEEMKQANLKFGLWGDEKREKKKERRKKTEWRRERRTSTKYNTQRTHHPKQHSSYTSF
jgi:hypothetical protein